MNRKLTSSEIGRLLANGCTADNWDNLSVAPGFVTDYVLNAHFQGRIVLGVFDHTFHGDGGFCHHSGIFNACLCNCEVGNGSLVMNVANSVSNCVIGQRVFICGVGTIGCRPGSTFGNGTMVAAVNEGGGRSFPVCTRTSSQMACLMAMSPWHNASKALVEAVEAFAGASRSNVCRIGDGASISGCGVIDSVNVGPFATLSGCSVLQNGSIVSREDAPCSIGSGVEARDFIVCRNASVTSGAQLLRCFVGEGSQVGEQFAATDCYIACNCQLFHGEAASVFAGPFSVSHHKSTLLIAGLFSFMNAGSGSNQSNHAYKLGPLHQGVTGRGCKLASSSYLLWPARLAEFTTVLGSIKSHPDCGEFPFSLLIGDHGSTFLVPGANLRSCGTYRDAAKWPRRDLRPKDGPLDALSFDLFTSLVAVKIVRACDILKDLLSNAAGNDVVSYKGMDIRVSSLKKGLELYSLALDKYYADLVVRKFLSSGCLDVGVRPDEDVASRNSSWCDLGGVALSEADLQDPLLVPVVSLPVERRLDAFSRIFSGSDSLRVDMEWNLSGLWRGLDEEGLASILSRGLSATQRLFSLAREDAEKEFNSFARVGYGALFSSPDDDFCAVRGDLETNGSLDFLDQELENYANSVSAIIAWFKNSKNKA